MTTNITTTPLIPRESPPLSGEELRRIRTSLGLTAAQLGQMLGRSTSTITRWEADAVATDSPRQLRLALVGLAAVLSGTATLREPLA
jgi:DNA-binding transcriptional regulator YiaG